MKIIDIDFAKTIRHHTLLYGETDTRKTYLTAQFIEFLIISEKVNPDNITILDFAPPLKTINNIKFGGKIKDYSEISLKCKYIPLKAEIIAPRFNAQNKKELYNYLCYNYRITQSCLQIFEENPTDYLIINDISLYLHLGNKKYLLYIINGSQTFFGNTYYGTEIISRFSKLLSIKERKKVQFLIKYIENPIPT